MLAKLYNWIVALLQQQQAYNELRCLDERMLRDIGLDRGQLSKY